MQTSKQGDEGHSYSLRQWGWCWRTCATLAPCRIATPCTTSATFWCFHDWHQTSYSEHTTNQIHQRPLWVRMSKNCSYMQSCSWDLWHKHCVCIGTVSYFLYRDIIIGNLPQLDIQVRYFHIKNLIHIFKKIKKWFCTYVHLHKIIIIQCHEKVLP